MRMQANAPPCSRCGLLIDESGAVATRCILLTCFPYLCSPIITPVAVMPLPQVITRFSISSGRFSVCAATAVSSVSPYPMILMPYWTIKLFSCAASSFARACKMLWRPERAASTMDAPYFIASRGIGRAATLSRVVPPYTILHGIPFARATAAVMGACGEWMLQYVSRLL